LFDEKCCDNQEVTLYCMPTLEEQKLQQGRDEYNRCIEEAQRQGYEEGFASGERAGMKSGEQKAIVLMDGLEKVLQETAMVRDNIVHELEEKVVGLSIAIAEKVISEEVKTRPELLLSVVRTALRKLQLVGTVTIKVNPLQYDMFMEHKSSLFDIHDDINIDSNSAVSLAGPLVISRSEEVVADIDEVFANLVSEMYRDKADREEESVGPGTPQEE